MFKRMVIVLMVLFFSIFTFNEVLISKTREVNYRGNSMTGFGRGRGKRSGGFREDGTGPFRDGRGPNVNCPLKNENQDADEIAQSERDDSGRALKRDGSGPNKDGQGPRGSNLGPKEDCPKK